MQSLSRDRSMAEEGQSTVIVTAIPLPSPSGCGRIKFYGGKRMKFAAFEGRTKRPVYVNPNRVTYVKEVSERSCLVYFGNEHAVEITMQASLVIEDLQRAASGK